MSGVAPSYAARSVRPDYAASVAADERRGCAEHPPRAVIDGVRRAGDRPVREPGFCPDVLGRVRAEPVNSNREW